MAASAPASGFRAAFQSVEDVDPAHRRPPEAAAAASSFYLGTAAAGRGRSTEFQNDELDVFGAEKYFGLDMDGDDDQKAAVAPEKPRRSPRVKEAKHTYRGRLPSARSTSTPGAGGSAFLRRDGQRAPPAPACRSAGGGGKMLLSVFRCSCTGGGTSDVVVNEMAGGGGGVENGAARWGIARRQLLQPELYGREKATSRPAGNLGASGGKTPDEKRKDHRVSAAVGKEAESGLGRRRNVDAAAAMAEDDDDASAFSESSSDLFEIDSVCTGTARRPGVAGSASTSTITCSAPSEASIAWSVVTASAANFSVASDGEQSPSVPENARRHRRPGAPMLLGCGSGKAVGISSNTRRLPMMAKAAEWPLYSRPTPPPAAELRYRPDRPAVVDIMQAQARRAVAEARSRSIYLRT